MKNDETPQCPVCGEETNDFYISDYGNEIVGCPKCVRMDDAWQRRDEDELSARIDYEYDRARDI